MLEHTMKYTYDVIVIGAGSGGLTTSIGLAKAGKKVLLLEKDLMGGDCTNVGCIPSKTLIHHARKYAYATSLSEETPQLTVYRESILSSVHKKVEEIRAEESPQKLKLQGITVVRGSASFHDAHTISVSTSTGKALHYTADYIVIATGAKARTLEIKGAEDHQVLTNETVFKLEYIPQRLLIVGTGPISCELGQAFCHLGTKVTLINRGHHILDKEDSIISQAVETTFSKQGIEILHGAEITHVEGTTASISQNDIVHTKEFDYILTAIGRVPNSKQLGLESLGILLTEQGQVKVDRHYRIPGYKHIFAVGDVASTAQFTHLADDMGRHVVKKILFPFASVKEKALPRVTYLDDEVATVGLTYEEAISYMNPSDIHTIILPYDASDRGKTDDLHGLIHITVKKFTGKILGASILGRGAGELINIFTVAIDNNLSLWRISRSIYPYPVVGRLIKKAGDQFLSHTLSHWKEDLLHVFRKHLIKVVAMLFWGALLTGFYFYKQVSSLTTVEIVVQLFQMITGTWYGPLLYILIYTLRPLILFPATPLTIMAGILYGFWGGVIYTLVGENASASLAYAMGNLLGKDMFPTEGKGLISRWKKKLQTNAFSTVLILRLLYLPFDLVNCLCGILHVRYRSYLTATALGTLPGVIAFVSIGASIQITELGTLLHGGTELQPEYFILGIVFLLSSLGFAAWLKRRQNTSTLQS